MPLSISRGICVQPLLLPYDSIYEENLKEFQKSANFSQKKGYILGFWSLSGK